MAWQWRRHTSPEDSHGPLAAPVDLARAMVPPTMFGCLPLDFARAMIPPTARHARARTPRRDHALHDMIAARGVEPLKLEIPPLVMININVSEQTRH